MPYTDYPTTTYSDSKRKKTFWHSAEGLSLISDWRREGMSLSAVADKMEISAGTLNSWAKKNEDLKLALNKTNEVVDSMVEDRLFARAIGYDAKEETWQLVDGRMTLVKVVTKHIPGDVKAQLAWLQSRRPDTWREHQDPIDNSETALASIDAVIVEIEEVSNEYQADA